MKENGDNRYMRLVLFFDLPMTNSYEIRNYNRFRKCIMKEGFIMQQESVYSKMVLNDNLAEKTIRKIRKIVCSLSLGGLVQILKVTEKQYAGMKYICGKEKEYEELDEYKELIII